MGMTQETETDDIEAYCPGLDCAVNCHTALLNVDKMTPIYDEAGLSRGKDPGAGAITPYHNGTTKVSRDIPVGGELFKDYGHGWFDYRYGVFGEIPMPEHYGEAQDLLEDFMELDIEDEQIRADLYAVVTAAKGRPLPSDTTIFGMRSSRILNALPNDYAKAKIAAASDLAILHQPAHTRDMEFLRQNGKCIDHIENKPSSIQQAGRGAFAVRALPKGTTISASPLHHVDRSFANMYNFTFDEESKAWIRVKDQIVGYQLMLNYCYAHPDSSIMLCPYGAGINYINHDRQRANVKIQWAKNFAVAHNQTAVESGPYSMFAQTEKPFLTFDYIATKDIAKGEELFLDYGDTWVEAWRKHVKEWKPVEGAATYVSARYWNEHYREDVLRTEEEQKHDPYPKHLELRCHNGLMNARGAVTFRWSITHFGQPCRILRRDIEDGDFHYTVEIEYRADEEDEEVTLVTKADVPRASIAFVDKPGTTDMHLPNAFRHPIGIPDEIFPEQWKNLLLEEEEGYYEETYDPEFEDEDEEYHHYQADDEVEYDDDDEVHDEL